MQFETTTVSIWTLRLTPRTLAFAVFPPFWKVRPHTFRFPARRMHSVAPPPSMTTSAGFPVAPRIVPEPLRCSAPFSPASLISCRW